MKNESIRKVINVEKHNYSPVWTFKQEDDGVLKLELFKGSIPLDLTGQTIKLGVIRANKTLVELEDQSCFKINNNELDITLKNNILSVAGIAECDLELIDKDGKMTTASFFININKKTIGSNSIQASNEISSLEKLKNDFKSDVEGMKEEYNSWKDTVLAENNVAKLQNEINGLGSQLDNKRIFKPNLYGNLNWSVSKKVDNIFPYTDETLNSWKGCIDGIIIDIQIKPNSETINDNTTYYLNPTIEWINYVVNKCKELNIVIKGVKFHADEIRTNVNNLTFVNWFNKYKELIRSVTNVLKCDYLLYFNESSSLLNREVTEINIINDFTNELKSLGFQVGFAGTGVKNLDKGYIFDIISFHQYPAISGKLNNTTYSDSVIAWEQNRNTYLVNKAIKDYPNKKIMLGEAGCPDSWECLAVPEKWDWNSNDLTPDMSGKPSAIFLYGMLETYKNTNLDCACFWYNDPMLKETQILLKKYL